MCSCRSLVRDATSLKRVQEAHESNACLSLVAHRHVKKGSVGPVSLCQRHRRGSLTA